MFAFCYFIYRYIWRSGVDITVINIIYLADKHIVNDAIEIKILSTLRLLSIENKTESKINYTKCPLKNYTSFLP